MIQFPDIAEKLESTFDKDQQDIVLDEGKERRKRVSENTDLLKDIINELGWPTISKVGDKASDVAWFLAQHSDYDLEFQKECLKMMQECEEGEVKKRHIAYLIDRVRKNEGNAQLYGTQFEANWQLWKVEDERNLNKRRAEMGMEPVEEYIERSKNYFKGN